MYRLLYISTARRGLTAAELNEVLLLSRRNNARVDVTGLLVTGGRRFLQALEGPEEAVRQTYERICRDSRHFAIVELVREPIETRSFAGWAMGSRDVGVAGGGPAGGTERADDAVARLIAPIADPRVRGYFVGFAAV